MLFHIEKHTVICKYIALEYDTSVRSNAPGSLARSRATTRRARSSAPGRMTRSGAVGLDGALKRAGPTGAPERAIEQRSVYPVGWRA